MTDLKVLVTTHNEEDNLPGCLASVEGLAAEVWVVDSFSEDATAELAENAGARVLKREYRSPSDQKNWALDQMGDGWILILDADERVSPELRGEIIDTMESPQAGAYWIPRRNRFLGREMRHAGWERDGVIRLIRGRAARYGEALVHEKMECAGPVGRMSHPLDHDSYRHLPDYLERMMRYSLSGGRELRRRGVRSSAARVLLRPWARFVRMYILQSGWRDGGHGFLLCFVSACQVGLKHAVHWALDHGIGRTSEDA